MRKVSRKPIAVLISDVHYSLNTFQVADTAFRMAVDKAAELGVPLIDNGDLTHDKALLRAEYTNAIIATLEYAADRGVRVYLNVGNHSLLHEKGAEHALNFLKAYATVISTPVSVDGFNFIPYQTSPEAFMEALRKFPEGSIVFAHQGTIGGQLGDYVKDATAIDPKLTRAWRIFLGHYHSHYELENTISIGNPYTLTFGEARDAAKGFLIVADDGSYSRVLTNLRRHVIVECTAGVVLDPIDGLKPTDLLWMKVEGPATELQKLSKKEIGMKHLGHQNFKLDKIYAEMRAIQADIEKLNDEQVFDRVIQESDESPKQKVFLKKLWREVLAA